MPIHRQIKNVVHNYTDSERKVREATSNDPWGPSSTLMAEIADKSHNAMALPEIMRMIWRRLNDRSKNWRHIYKALVLLEYLIKMGSEKVATQCRENIHAIETLKEFEYVEDGKDLGHNVRARANAVAGLLRNRDRLEEEREKALLARERLSHGGLGTVVSSRGSPAVLWHAGHQRATDTNLHTRGRASPNIMRTTCSSLNFRSNPEVDSFRPQSAGEEELQLQLALAISKEEHDLEESRRRDEEAKVQMALEQSKRNTTPFQQVNNSNNTGSSDGTGLFNLLDTSLSVAPANLPDPWGASAGSASTISNQAIPTAVQPPVYTPSADASSIIPIDDPWAYPPTIRDGTTVPDFVDARHPNDGGAAPWDNIWSLQQALEPPLLELSSNHTETGKFTPKTNGMESFLEHNGNTADASNGLLSTVTQATSENAASAADDVSKTESRRTPADFLGEHQRLVDLEKLIERPPNSTNPFATAPRDPGRGAPSNPFLISASTKPSLNELAPNRGPPSLSLPPPNVFPSAAPFPALLPSSPSMAPQNQNMAMHGYAAPGGIGTNPGIYPMPSTYTGHTTVPPFSPLTTPTQMAFPTSTGQGMPQFGPASNAASNPFY